MKIILIEDVKDLGKKGEVIETSEGYARNFLFPQHFAIEASEEALRTLKEQEKAQTRREKKQETEEKKIASSLEGKECVISAKADHGKLYGAVTAKDISLAIKKIGFSIPESWISFEPQKEVGTFEATVTVPSGFEAVISVSIESST
ncbi:MAG: 50S ribosomal protein L9 [Patescibacteria group bacterium]|jgi:large subunit ribosomal protein L9